MTGQSNRVLIVCERFPQPVRGGSDLHVLGLAQAMSAFATIGMVSITSTVASAPAFAQQWQASASPVPLGNALLRHAFTNPDDPFAPYVSADASDVLRAAIDAFAPAVIVAYRLQCWRVLSAVLRDGDPPAILDLDESTTRSVAAMESLDSSDPAMRVRIRFTRAAARYERLATRQAAEVWLCTSVEAAHLAASTPTSRLSVVHNVVDPSAYSGGPATGERRGLVYPGNFSYPPNAAAARELADRIAPMLPDHAITLVGSHVPSWLRTHPSPNVHAIGPVESIVDYLQSASAAVLPIRAGTGSRMKVLECLAAGTPVVSTDIGVEGLDLVPDRHYVSADSVDDFVAAVHRIDDDPALAAGLAADGQAIVRDRHSIASLVPVVAEAIAKVAQVPAVFGTAG